MNNQYGRLQSKWSTGLLVLTLLLFVGVPSFCQTFPAFNPQPGQQSIIDPVLRSVDLAVGSAPATGQVLYAFYADGNQKVTVAFSGDGVNYQNAVNIQNPQAPGYDFGVLCYTDRTAVCGVSSVAAPDGIYIAFLDHNTNGLTVLKGVQCDLRSDPCLTWTIVHQEPAGMTTVPGMLYYNSRIFINYGTTDQNKGYLTIYNYLTGQWTNGFNNNTYASNKPALVAYNNTVYQIVKQNNAENHIFQVQLDPNSGIFIQGTSVEINPNWQTNSGVSGLVYQNQLVFAGRSNDSDWFLDLYAATNPNANAWSAHSYSNLVIGDAPAIALFKGGIAVAYRTRTSSEGANYIAGAYSTY